jgi:hypothetical protein
MALTQISTQGIKDGTITGTDLATNVDLVDNQKLRLGTGNDLQIYHSGSHSFIDGTGTGNLILKGDSNTQVLGSNVWLLDASGTEFMFKGVQNAQVELYYDNSKKFETTSTGATVTGTISAGGAILSGNQSIASDSAKLFFGASNDLEIYHNGSHSYIDDAGTGNLYIRSSQLVLQNAAGDEDLAILTSNGAVKLYFNDSKKFETNTYGALVSGSLFTTAHVYFGNQTSDNCKAFFGAGNDLEISHDGTTSLIKSSSHPLAYYSNTRHHFLNGDGSENMAVFVADGQCELYHNGSKKFETNSTGTIVTGQQRFTNTGVASSYIGANSDGGIFGTDTAGLVLKTGVTGGDVTSTGTPRMTIDSSGNVGIGTASPAYTNALFGGSQRTFHLIGTAAPQLRIQSSTSGQADLLLQAGNSGSTAYIANAASGGDLFFSTNNGGSQGTRFAIKDDGKVGIGTTSPGAPLTIDTGGTADALRIGNSAGTDTFIRLGSTGTNTDTHAVIKYDKDDNYLSMVVAGESHGGGGILIANGGNVGIGTTSPQNMIHTSSANDSSGIRMTNTYDTPDNVWALLPSISGVSNTGFTIRDVTDGRNCLVIDGIGRVSIGTSSTNSRLLVETTANTMVPMAVNDSSNTSTLTHRIAIRTNGTEVGSIKSTNSATQYNTQGSDRTLKKNFESWNEDVLSLFKNINPQKFNFIQEEDGANKSKGFIAQEITNSFPEAYTKGEGENDKYWFNPSGMVVYLMKAIQELEAEVAALKAS